MERALKRPGCPQPLWLWGVAVENNGAHLHEVRAVLAVGLGEAAAAGEGARQRGRVVEVTLVERAVGERYGFLCRICAAGRAAGLSARRIVNFTGGARGSG